MVPFVEGNEKKRAREKHEKEKKASKVSSSTSSPRRDSERRFASDDESDDDDDDSEEEPEWSAPAEMGAGSRRRRIVPPSSPFQDAPILDGSDGATPAVAGMPSRIDASSLNDASLKQSDSALLETRVLELTNAARDKRPGAAAELARFLAEIQFRDEKTHKKTPSSKTSMIYSPASCDSALERAATAEHHLPSTRTLHLVLCVRV